VIDPGHGGINARHDQRAGQPPEKEFTLDWAKRLKPLLETNGWTVFLTRTNDTISTNSNRVVFAETHHADLFISLHFNSAAPDKKPPGWKPIASRPPECRPPHARLFRSVDGKIFRTTRFDAQNFQLAVRLHRRVCARPARKTAACAARASWACCAGKNARRFDRRRLSLESARGEKLKAADFRQKLAEAVAKSPRFRNEKK
jgi:hypothetical protein